MYHSHPSYNARPCTRDALQHVAEDMARCLGALSRDAFTSNAHERCKLFSTTAPEYPVVVTLLPETGVEQVLFLLSYCTRAEVVGPLDDPKCVTLRKIVACVSAKHGAMQSEFLDLYLTIARKVQVNQFAFVCFHLLGERTTARTYEWRLCDSGKKEWFTRFYHMMVWEGSMYPLQNPEMRRALDALSLVSGQTLRALDGRWSSLKRSKMLTNAAIFVLSRFARHIRKMSYPRGCVAYSRVYFFSQMTMKLYHIDYDVGAVADFMHRKDTPVAEPRAECHGT